MIRNGKLSKQLPATLKEKRKQFKELQKLLIKQQETQVLIEFIDANKLWFNNFDKSKDSGEGAAQ